MKCNAKPIGSVRENGEIVTEIGLAPGGPAGVRRSAAYSGTRRSKFGGPVGGPAINLKEEPKRHGNR